MRTIARAILTLGTTAVIAACSVAPSTTPAIDESSSPSMQALPETRSVSYRGKITESEESSTGLSLVTPEGVRVVIAATDQNLDLRRYIDSLVEVRGSVQPVGEEDSILRVEEIVVLSPAVTSIASSMDAQKTFCGGFTGGTCPVGFSCVDDLTDDCDPDAGGADCGGVCVATGDSPASLSSSQESSSSMPRSKDSFSLSSSQATTSSARSMSSSVAAVASTSSSLAAVSPSTLARSADTQTMSKQDYAPTSLWTQQYCTTHVGFCIPVHKNWYYKSFGATTSSLWHVEFSMSSINELGQGSIWLNLVSGSSADANLVTGQITPSGSDVLGALDWQGNHFELIADASLRPAIEYMLMHITPFTPAS